MGKEGASNLVSLLSKSLEPVVDMHNNDCVFCICARTHGLVIELDLFTDFLLFTKFQEDSMEHLQRARHTNRGRLLLRTPGPVPLWDLHVF